MKDFIYFILFFVISILLYKESLEKNSIQTKGRIVKVAIKNIQGGRLCTGVVDFNEKSYSVEFAKNDCYNNSLSIGSKIELRYLDEIDKFIIPSSNTIVMYYISLAFFTVPLFFLLKMIKKNFT
jgi:hypothetical protein